MATGGMGDILTGVLRRIGGTRFCLFMMRRDSAHGYAGAPRKSQFFNGKPERAIVTCRADILDHLGDVF